MSTLAAPSPEPNPTMASLSSPRGPKTIKFNKDSSINVSNSAASGTRGGAKATLVSAAGKDGSVHSFSLEEATAFTEHLNHALGATATAEEWPDHAAYLPLKPPTDKDGDGTVAGFEVDLFTKVHDGVLLCRFINLAVPGTIDMRVVNEKGKGKRDQRNKELNLYQCRENQNLCINAAKAIGCQLTNVHATSLLRGEQHPHIVLGLVWQLVKTQLLQEINLKMHPELIALLLPGEELADLMALPPDQLLLRWLNYHLKAAGSSRRATNFSSDLQDSEIYATVLPQLDESSTGEQCRRALAIPVGEGKQKDRAALEERAAEVIDAARAMGAKPFVQPRDIADGNPKLNLAFVASMFNTRHGLEQPDEEALAEMAGMLDDDEGDTREERVFRMWINSLGLPLPAALKDSQSDAQGGAPLYLNDLYNDMKDGIALLMVEEEVGAEVDWKKKVNLKRPLNKFRRLENCNYAVALGRGRGPGQLSLVLESIGGVDVVDARKKLVLGIVWQLMRLHSLRLLSRLGEGGGKGGLISEDAIVQWANQAVASSRCKGCPAAAGGMTMKSFKDPSLQDSIFLLRLCAAMRPGIVNWEEIVELDDTTSAAARENNAKYAISVARALGCCVFLTWEDITEGKHKMVMTFVASIMDNSRRESESE